MSRAEYMRKWRKQRVIDKKCTVCSNDAGGQYLCPECRKKRKPYMKEYLKDYGPVYWSENKDRINKKRRKNNDT